jgi:cysteine desulfurase
MLTINSGKIYGPKQCGALYIKAGIVISPLIMGGGQEFNLRSGTENLANIIGFSSSLDIITSSRKSEATRLSGIRDEFITLLLDKFSNIKLNGPTGNKRLANNVHVTILGYDNERLLMMLDESGFQIATGSACSASDSEPSHVLSAIGLSSTESQNSIRVTFGRSSTKESSHALIDSITKILE